MFTSTHSAAGIFFALTINDPAVAIALSVASHFPLDCCKESEPYGGWANIIKYDFILMTGSMLALAFFLYPQNWTVIWGCVFAANAPDAWDKSREYILKKPQQLWCHQDWWPTWWTMTVDQTLDVNIASTIAACLFLLAS